MPHSITIHLVVGCVVWRGSSNISPRSEDGGRRDFGGNRNLDCHTVMTLFPHKFSSFVIGCSMELFALIDSALSPQIRPKFRSDGGAEDAREQGNDYCPLIHYQKHVCRSIMKFLAVSVCLAVLPLNSIILCLRQRR